MVPSEESFPIGFKPHIAEGQSRAHWLILRPTYSSWKQIKTLTRKKDQIATLNLHSDPPPQGKDFLTSSVRWLQYFSLLLAGAGLVENISCGLSPFFPQFANPISCLLHISLLLVSAHYEVGGRNHPDGQGCAGAVCFRSGLLYLGR